MATRDGDGCDGDESRTSLSRRRADPLNVVAIVGHTASGKSPVAEAVASRFGAEILSVDSMQVYRGMNIGTAKPSPATLAAIPHHMVDIVDPNDDYDVRRFQADASPIVAGALETNSRIVIAGGSGLHFRALVDHMTFAPTDPTIRLELEGTPLPELQALLADVDADAGSVVDVDNPRRLVRAIEVYRITGATPSERYGSPEAVALRNYEPAVPHLSIGLDAGERAGDRADTRFRAMMDAGLLREVVALAHRLGRSASKAVGYKQMIEVVSGSVSLETGVEAAITSTRKLIKRQRTYFRRDPRIKWLAWQDDEETRIRDAVALIEQEAKWTS